MMFFRITYRPFVPITFIVSVIVLLGASFYVGYGAPGPSDDARGWIWNAFQPTGWTADKIGAGWTSMSCLNDFDNDAQLENQCDAASVNKQYGLDLNLGGAGNILDGQGDYLQGCAWSSAYGWLCFNGGNGSTYQCDSSVNAACGDLSTSGVEIKKRAHCSTTYSTTCQLNSDCPGTESCQLDFYYLDSPAYNGGAWEASLAATRRASILSLWSAGDPAKSYVSFPSATDAVSPLSNTVFGCMGCDSATGKCRACLNASTDAEDPSTNPNPNYLCWDCGNSGFSCTIHEEGGSCVSNRDKNVCNAAYCRGCTRYTGVIVNQNTQGELEMCGWGYNAYEDSGSLTNVPVTLDDQATNSSGDGLSMVISSVDNLPFFVYNVQNADDMSSWYVKVMKCRDPLCISKSTRLMERIDRVSRTAAAIGADNKPVIAYYNESAGRMTIVKCGDADCSTSGTPLSVESPLIVGYSKPSVIIPPDGLAVLSYYGGNGGLEVFKCSDTDCTTGAGPTPVDPGVDMGRESSIALDAIDGFPIISYSDSALADLKFVKCSEASCATFLPPVTIDSDGIVGSNISMVVADGLPIISYTDYNGADKLKVARCTNNMCTESTRTIIPGTGAIVEDTSVILGADGMPVISYYDAAGGDLEVAKCSSLTCDSGVSLNTVDFDGTTGQYSHVQLAVDDTPAIGYYDVTVEALRYVKCASASCGTAGGQDKGLGWFAINPQHTGGTAYIEAYRGNVLSGGNIFSPAGPPVSKYNAAYLIEAGGTIKNWFSEQAYTYQEQGGLPRFLSGCSNQPDTYTNLLGKLDYRGLVTATSTGKVIDAVTPTPRNKYGSKLVFRQSPTNDIPASVFGDTIYYWAGNTILADGGAKTIGCQTGQSGSGMVIVEGDLEIKNNVTYASCTYSTLREIPSLVWIVRGDLTIAPTVSELAGTFIVLGTVSSGTCPSLKLASNGCGRFSSGNDSATPTALVINGSVLARQFNLQRSYSSSLGPAEQFKADGRVQTNPPTGLTDFSKALPRFSSGQ